jgi:hypothetical protein
VSPIEGWVTAHPVTFFGALFIVFGVFAFWSGLCWGADKRDHLAAQLAALTPRPAAQLEPVTLTMPPVPSAPPWWAGHAGPRGEQLIGRDQWSPEAKRLAALADETDAAFDAISAQLAVDLTPCPPTAPIRPLPRFIPVASADGYTRGGPPAYRAEGWPR